MLKITSIEINNVDVDVSTVDMQFKSVTAKQQYIIFAQEGELEYKIQLLSHLNNHKSMIDKIMNNFRYIGSSLQDINIYENSEEYNFLKSNIIEMHHKFLPLVNNDKIEIKQVSKEFIKKDIERKIII